MPAIIYRRNGRPITLFQGAPGDAVSLAMRGQRNGYHVLAWSDDSSAFVAVSDLPAEDLDQLEEALGPSEPLLKMDAREAVV
jgi:anti-sigma factor RsiW